MMRLFISLSLTLMLALTSQAMAVTRGASAAAGQMVVCNGDGTMTVYVDAEGTPTTAPHVCPECLVSMAFAPEPAGALVPLRLVLGAVPRWAVAQIETPVLHRGPLPRAPPLVG